MTSQAPQEEPPKKASEPVVKPDCFYVGCKDPAVVTFSWPGKKMQSACPGHGRRAQRIARGLGFKLELTVTAEPKVEGAKEASPPVQPQGPCKACGKPVLFHRLPGGAVSVEHATPICGAFIDRMAQFDTYARAVRKDLIDDSLGLIK